MLKKLLKALGIIPEQKQNEVVHEVREEVRPQPWNPAPQLTEAEWQVRFRDILLNHFAQYSFKENVPVTELTGDVQDQLGLYADRPNQVYKAEWGKPYNFVIYADDKPKAVIMLGPGRSHISRVVYLISRMYAKKLDLPYLGFYTHFSNRDDYVINRIREALGE